MNGLDLLAVGAFAVVSAAFWLAGFYALEGLVDPAIEWVQHAVRLGNENYPLFADSRKLDALRADGRFIALMAELKQRWEVRTSSRLA